MKQLDTLRAFAVLAVLYSHFYDVKLSTHLFLKNPIGWGGIGVRFFFVLSGFLITSILLKNRIEIEAGKSTFTTAIKNFYLRRSLRIFPIYFLTIAITFILSIHPVRETFWWLVTYTSNLYFALKGEMNGPISHLWSLSVEEQFYCVWPCVILFVPRKYIVYLLLAIIAVGPLYRHICNLVGLNQTVKYVITLSHMDLFGLGGLLAYIKTFNVSNKTTAIFFRICILSGPIYLVALVVYSFRLYNPFQIFVQVSAGLFFCWIIYKASNGFTGIVGKVMEFRPLLYIGKISYGIYLYHYFVPSIISDHFKQLDAIINNSTELQALTYSITTIIIATASWHLIEKPVMALKEKYNKIQLHNSIASNRLLNTDRLTNLSD